MLASKLKGLRLESKSRPEIRGGKTTESEARSLTAQGTETEPQRYRERHSKPGQSQESLRHSKPGQTQDSLRHTETVRHTATRQRDTAS